MNEVLQEFISLLCEGVWDKETTDISRQIVRKLVDPKTFKGRKRVAKFSIKGLTKNIPNVDVVNVTVKKKPKSRHHMEDFVQAEYVWDTTERKPGTPRKGRIEIQIDITHGEKERLDYIIPDLKKSIRHELEHASQDDEMLSWPNNYYETPADVEDYYSDPAEVAAWTLGLYKHAKTEKVFYDVSLKWKFDDIRFDAKKRGASEQEAQAIVKRVWSKWRRYIDQRLPDASKFIRKDPTLL